MEGKNCFRTQWTQEPIFSGGNIASLAVPHRSFDHIRQEQQQQAAAVAGAEKTTSDASAARAALPDYDECLVTACGDTIHVIRAATGEALCSYTLPLEDVILHVDAVSVLTEDQHVPFGQQAMAAAAGEGASDDTKDTNTKGKGKKVPGKGGKQAKKQADSGDAVKPEADAEEGQPSSPAANPELSVPMGCYIACGTRALQLYMLQVVITESVPLVTPKDKSDNEEEDRRDVAEPAAASLEPIVEYDLRVVRNWTAAQQAISLVYFTDGGHFLVSGSTDGGIKVWNAFHHHLTHNFRCPNTGLLQTVYVDPAETYLIAGSFEGHITVFDFVEKTMLAHSRPHVQAVDAISLTEDGTHILSIARDRRLSLQSLSLSPAQKGKRRTYALAEERAVVVKEHVSAALFENPHTLHVGSMDGVLATYRIDGDPKCAAIATVVSRSAKPPTSKAEDANEETMAKSMLIRGKPKGSVRSPSIKGFRVDDFTDRQRSSLYMADAGFNITKMVHQESTNEYVGTGALVGFLDQILDIKTFAPGCPSKDFPYERVIVNNSKDVRLYGERGCFSGQVLQGHSDVVMSCAVSADGSLIATGGKDTEVRFWSTATWQTVAIGVKGHTAEITSMCFNAKQTESYLLLFTIAADENVRLWDVGQNVLPALKKAKEPVTFENKAGINSAHVGPVFTIAMAPNDQYVATGGKDKVVNLWNITGKKIYKEGTLKGHRRGISSLAFSPADRVLASASNDGSVRLWSLVSLSCVKALQVDKVPVLQVAFFNNGTQLVTGNAEGVLRVWAVAASEAVWSSEAHHEKIWALDVIERDGETLFLSGAADGVLIATEDYTAEEVTRVKQDRHDVILKEQALANAMRRGEFTDAFILALQLNHPRHLRQVLVRWCAVDAAQCEDTMRTELLPSLSDDHIVRLLQFTREWITNSRHCMVASLVIYTFLSSRHYQELAALPPMQALLEPLLAYSQRHSQRQHELMRRTYYIDFVTQSIVGGGNAQKVLTSMPPFVRADGKRAAPEDESDASPLATGQKNGKKGKQAKQPPAKKARTA